MAQATTIKPINLQQLATELGGVGLSMSDDGSERTITTDQVDQTTLDAAVTAHDAQPELPPPTPIDLQTQIDQLTDMVLGV